MMRVAIIHTTPVTVEPLGVLAREVLPGCEVVNWVDDSILPQLAGNGADVGEVEDRLVHYTRFAEEVGADVVLHACSSVGEVVAKTQQAVSIPVVRIDEAMAEEAVGRGERIGVVATLETTLQPTLILLRRKAEEAGKEVTLEPRLVDAAYQRLIAGDQAGHDEVLAEALEQLAQEVDVVVLAQASMARVLPRLPESQRERFLTSPQLAMARVKQVVENRPNE
ncbi:MAG: aspartate/glutamate racemase family protein [Chloroflexota bacterium]|nr:aspartate/glutamate racemase family protein [Chloroflexota bacterium]